MPSCRWRRVDLPGTDEATLTSMDHGYLLAGRARFEDPAGTVDLRYSVEIGLTWRTERARVNGTGPRGWLDFRIEVRGNEWYFDDRPVPGVSGCVDLDLNFTPATNLLSIRRLGLAAGQSAEVVAAWLDFPSPALKPLRQIYQCQTPGRYGYLCPELPFESVLRVDPDGFVTSYPPLWEPDV